MIGSDVAFFCPTDGATVNPAANGSVSQTFSPTAGSAVVPTSATTVGTVYPGSSIVFTSTPSQTFATVMGSATVVTSATTVGYLYPGGLITFASDATVYTIATVTSVHITLTVVYGGTGDMADTATVDSKAYTVLSVDGTALTLTAPVTEFTDTLVAGDVVGGTNLTVLFPSQPFVRSITASTAGTLILSMLGPRGSVFPVTLHAIAGELYPGCWTSVGASSSASGIVVFV